MSWLITPTQKTDPDALAYLAEVERADGQALESGVRDAVIAFVTGCKADGIWDAIKASCILAGARTLNGCLVPLTGTAPTNFNFVSGDYNRETGLVGNGSTKYLSTNRNSDADPQDNKHLATYKGAGGASLGALLGTNVVANGTSWLFDNTITNQDTIRVNANPSVGGLNFPATGFIGATRSSSATITYRFSATNTSASSTSQTPVNEIIDVFRGAASQYTDARLSFYSIGESLDLAKLDTRVTDLMTAIGAAIP